MEKTKFIVKVLALVVIVPLLVFAELKHASKTKRKGPHGIEYEVGVNDSAISIGKTNLVTL